MTRRSDDGGGGAATVRLRAHTVTRIMRARNKPNISSARRHIVGKVVIIPLVFGWLVGWLVGAHRNCSQISVMHGF